jgi:pyridoxal phosphate enzyme (YggS family)
MLSDNLQAVRKRIADAAGRAGRDAAGITLLAVSKTQGPDRIEEVFHAGQVAFGENYVQEALDKMNTLAHCPVSWHLVGPLQGNKTRAVAERFDWVQTVDRERIAARLSAARPASLPPLQVLVQVNVSGEATKSGVAPEEVPALARAVAALPRLALRGLMAIPEPTADTSVQRARFREVRELFERLRAEGLPLDTLSMGMSADMDSAIAEGSTMVRIGTALFGARGHSRVPSRSPVPAD